jgi:hypothetical protein
MVRWGKKPQRKRGMSLTLVPLTLYADDFLISTAVHDKSSEAATFDAVGVQTLGVFLNVEAPFGIVAIYDCCA